MCASATFFQFTVGYKNMTEFSTNWHWSTLNSTKHETIKLFLCNDISIIYDLQFWIFNVPVSSSSIMPTYPAMNHVLFMQFLNIFLAHIMLGSSLFYQLEYNTTSCQLLETCLDILKTFTLLQKCHFSAYESYRITLCNFELRIHMLENNHFH